MANLIDYSYFIRQINLPNINNSNPANGQNSELQDMIDLYEGDFLTQFLGYEMYKDFLAKVNVITDPLYNAYQFLLNGKEFIGRNGRLNNWIGFNNTLKFTNISQYIYYQVQAHRASNSVGVGETVTSTTNGIRYSPANKMIQAWNKMVDINWVLDDFLTQNKSDYTLYHSRSLNNCGGCSYHNFYANYNNPCQFNTCRHNSINQIFVKIPVHNFGI